MRYAICCLFALALTSALPGQTIASNLFNGLQWRLIGPFRGGRSVAVTGVPGGGSTFFFGGVDGGVWKTTDAGTTWTNISDAAGIASVGALEAAPSNAEIIYAGAGESDIRSDLATGDGVWKTADGGATWRNIGLKETRQISRIAVDPRDPDKVLVAALGHAYGPNEERGVFLTRDGGRTWTKSLYVSTSVGASDVAIAADAPEVAFAAMWEAHRAPWSVYAPLAGPGSAIYRSTDGGATWQKLSGNGLPAKPVGRIGVAIARGTHGKRIYAVIEADAKDAGLYRSDDGGDSWKRVNADPRITSRGWYFNSITVDPNDPDVVYDPNVALYKLSEGGAKLSVVRGAPGGDDYHQLWVDPANSKHMVLATDQGTTVSLNGGETWSTWYNQPTAQLYHVITDNEFPYHVYGSQQDSGSAAVSSRNDRGQIDARDFSNVGGSESGYVAPDPKDPDIFYVSGLFGTVDRFDRRTSQSQNIAPWPMPSGLADPSERKYRDPWTPVLVFSQAQPNALYLGTQYVMRTLDGGLHWQAISPDLTGAVKTMEKPAAPAAFENARERGYGVVYSIAPSPLRAGLVWAGSDSGLIHVTRDGGAHWADVTPPGLSAWSKVTQIEASHFDPAVAYAAVDRHRLEDMRPYLYRTRDFGKTWQMVATGIGERSFLNSIREDPKRRGLLYAATEFGVYISFDDGDRWLPLQLNLPVTSVRDLAVHGDDLVAATHGRSFWILDNVSALRQIDEKVAASSAHLFQPARAIRMTSDGFLGTPLPPEEPQAKNPSRGASIDYYLADSASEVKLQILDSKGSVIRAYSSQDKPAPPPANAPIAPRWFGKPLQLSGEPGMHRFVWDLRYERSGNGLAEDDDDDEEERWLGPLVLPGSYRVKLTVGENSLEQPLTVAMDPRSRVTPSELNLQFQSAQKAFRDMIQARRALAQLTAIQSQLTAAGESHSTLMSATAAALKQAGAILRGPDGTRDQGLQTISRALTGVLNSLEGADRTPPSQLLEVYRLAAEGLKSRLKEWDSFKTNVVPGINQQLREAGLLPINMARIEAEAEDSLAR